MGAGGAQAAEGAHCIKVVIQNNEKILSCPRIPPQPTVEAGRSGLVVVLNQVHPGPSDIESDVHVALSVPAPGAAFHAQSENFKLGV